METLSYERQKQLDHAVTMNASRADLLELKFGERTESESTHEGKFIFKFKNYFCAADGKITTRIISVNTKGF
jgi:hypothetical protein